ncbi:hypothetical protein SDRG_16330 [Saprolegnia diclina VS20]|uniref:Metallo-beta-lactamase domain-containing protein n=1 Tax=Saprolegnia diclina (strain VS20) TaxID=1156394 RepID=T0PXQ6_SAPDV|nr:hypothetical protein SDRG_16330 [Saprolegnia diclina VS20]EQC25815.1 hypothetical protein SDRG_16330 [Saprolegnia diclina VS20]|eukprot:XP_008620757.1 hypothetical protein SDRG_16330 [Saprolegnia diclina VS20]
MEIIFLGTGGSSSIPWMQCLLSGTNCAVCHHAHAVPSSKNRRNNPSLLVRYGGRNVLIDCGKTFRDSVLKVFLAKNIKSLDAIVLTHGHADACLGLDDVRELQVFTRCAEGGDDKKMANEPMYVHCHPRTKAEVGPKFDYLMLPPLKADASSYRWTAKLDWKVFEDFGSFDAAGVAFTALPVMHGKGYLCSGFEFGAEVGARFVYLSDLHELPSTTRAHLVANPAPIDVLVIDAIYLQAVHGAHLNLPQAIEIIKLLRPKKTYLVGMSHEFDYDVHNRSIRADVLREANLDVEMAYDGLEVALGPA